MKKINVEKSIVYKFDDIDDLASCVQMLGEKGYFSDDENFEHYEYGTLSEVKCWLEKCRNPFVKGDGQTSWYKYFITENLAVFEEKKLRPYRGVDEFSNETGCEVVGGDVLTIRNKKGKQEKLLLFTGYSDTAVHLGAYLITFTNLLCDYEYTLDGSEWLPFGIEC